MKTAWIGLVTMMACLGVLAGCSKKGTPGGGGTKVPRWVTIQVGGTHGCEVDYPVAVVYISKHYPRWASNDNEYWIHFVQPGSPFSANPIHVPAGGKSDQLDLTGQPNYYYYEIVTRDPATNTQKTCKDATDEHDTGLNVKR